MIAASYSEFAEVHRSLHQIQGSWYDGFVFGEADPTYPEGCIDVQSDTPCNPEHQQVLRNNHWSLQGHKGLGRGRVEQGRRRTMQLSTVLPSSRMFACPPRSVLRGVTCMRKLPALMQETSAYLHVRHPLAIIQSLSIRRPFHGLLLHSRIHKRINGVAHLLHVI